MQQRVIAIVVARRGGAVLQQTLHALGQQTRRPDLLVVVDAASVDAVTAQLAAANPTQFVTASPTLGFGELVHRGLGALPVAETVNTPYGGVEEWLWLLRHDTTPDPRALERLLAAVEIAPSVAAAGPKQLEAQHPTMIASYGETVSSYGASIAIAERELDQAQHDRTSDVLAVGEAGMLVRRSVYNAVEGFDPALPSVDAALDLCVRIRLAGHRVIGVPQARLFAHEGTALAGRPGVAPTISTRTVARLHRGAQLHRRLVYAPALAVPMHWLSLLPLAIVRSLGHLLSKRPTLVTGELHAALAVAFSGSAVPSARRRLARGRALGWATIAPLRMPPGEVRRRRAIVSDARLSAFEDSRPPRPDFLPGGAAVVGLMAIVGAIAFAPLIGAPALLGGALAPLAPDLPALLAGLQRTSVGAADPFAFVLVLLGLLTPWQPSLSIVVLFIAALPLAALGAWWAAAVLVRRAGPAAVVALVWALSPTLLVALSLGRPAAVIAHLALPVLIASAARAPRSWSGTAVAGLTAAVIVACSPSLLPALLLAWLVWMLANPRRFGRLLTLPVPTLALLVPLVIDQVLRGTPLGLLADPGLASASGVTSTAGLLLGWPDLAPVLDAAARVLPDTAPTAVVAVLAALALPLFAVALVGLALPEGRRSIVPLVLAAVGIVTAWSVSGIAITAVAGQPVAVNVGPSLSLAVLGIALAAGVGLDALGASVVQWRPAGGLATALGLLVVLAASAVAAPALVPVLAGTSVVTAGEPRTLPAIVAAEAQNNPGVGTIVLTPLEGGMAATLQRGSGMTLIEQRTLVSTAALVSSGLPGTGANPQTINAVDAAALEIAEIVGNLAAPSGRDLTVALDELDVRFVLLETVAFAPESTPESTSAPAQPVSDISGSALDAITAALDGNAILTPIGDADTGRLWRVVPESTMRAPINDPLLSSPIILGVQLGILGLTLLLALPTSFATRRTRAELATDHTAAPTFEAADDDD